MFLIKYHNEIQFPSCFIWHFVNQHFVNGTETVPLCWIIRYYVELYRLYISTDNVTTVGYCKPQTVWFNIQIQTILIETCLCSGWEVEIIEFSWIPSRIEPGTVFTRRNPHRQCFCTSIYMCRVVIVWCCWKVRPSWRLLATEIKASCCSLEPWHG